MLNRDLGCQLKSQLQSALQSVNDNSKIVVSHSIFEELDNLSAVTAIYNGNNKPLYNMIRKMIGQKRDQLERHINSVENDNDGFKSIELVSDEGKKDDNENADRNNYDDVERNAETEEGSQVMPKMYFHKFSPLAKEFIKVKCSHCTKTLESSRGYVNHMKKEHPETKFSIEDEKGTCYLPSKDNPSAICGQKFVKDQILRHFKVSGVLKLYIS